MFIEGSTDNVEEDPRHLSSMLMGIVKNSQNDSKNITNAYDSITLSENNKLPPAIMDVIKASTSSLTDPKAAIRDLGKLFFKYLFLYEIKYDCMHFIVVNNQTFVYEIILYSLKYIKCIMFSYLNKKL